MSVSWPVAWKKSAHFAGLFAVESCLFLRPFLYIICML